MRAVTHAQTVLSWQENLSQDEMPPEWMWPFDEELEGWFDDVAAKRKERFGIDDDDAGGAMTENALADEWRR